MYAISPAPTFPPSFPLPDVVIWCIASTWMMHEEESEMQIRAQLYWGLIRLQRNWWISCMCVVAVSAVSTKVDRWEFGEEWTAAGMSGGNCSQERMLTEPACSCLGSAQWQWCGSHSRDYQEGESRVKHWSCGHFSLQGRDKGHWRYCSSKWSCRWQVSWRHWSKRIMAPFQNPTSFFMERLQGGIEVHNKTNVIFSVFKRPNYCKSTGLKFHAKSIL